MSQTDRQVRHIDLGDLTPEECMAVIETMRDETLLVDAQQIHRLPGREPGHECIQRTHAQARLLHPQAKLPSRNRESDAGYDVYSIEEITISPGRTCMVRTGIQLAVPVGWYYTIDGRSGMWSKGILAYRGIIDSGYIGECVVALQNTTTVEYLVQPEDRVAQIILHRAFAMDITTVAEFTAGYNHRGTSGFGASGR